jgi:anti-anti-sigma factor
VQYKHLRIRAEGDVAVVQILGTRIAGVLETEELGHELYQLLDEENYTKIVLDLSLVEHTSSAIFGKLIHLNAKVKARGGRIWLCSIQPAVLEVIHTCKLDSIFDIRQDEADALPRF